MIPSPTPGTVISVAAWGAEVTAALNDGLGVTALFTPNLTNCVVGTGGDVFNEARYVYVGGPEVGDYGILSVSGRIVLGTSGASMGSTPTATLPAGFNLAAHVSTTTHRFGTMTTSGGMGYVQRASASTVGFVVATASGTYVSIANITSSVPQTWAAGDYITYNYIAPVVRV